MSKKKLYLVDGSNYVFRAYYAIGPLSTSKGLPTNALYGFTQMILKLISQFSPDYMVVAFDTKEPTFRDELYKEYKAHRPEPPDDLVQQFPYFNPILEALNVPILALPGFEADDVIGTVAKKLASDDLEVVVVSGDKDLMQLVDDNISMYDGMKDLHIGKKEVLERFGVGPSQVTEVLGLAGDSSDNVPGVPGVGPKTASKLIQEYGSIEKLIKNADKLSPNIASKIKENKDKAVLSKKLVTIDVDAPVKFKLADLVVGSPDTKKIRELFTELEFSKLLSTLAPQTTIDRSGYSVVDSKKELKNWLDKVRKLKELAIDLETTSLDVTEAEIVGISIAVSPGEACYIPVGHISQGMTRDFFDCISVKEGQLPLQFVLDQIEAVLKDDKIKKIGQNLKYDFSILKHYKIEICGPLFDTMIASYLLNPGSRHNLDLLSEQYLGHKKITYSELVSKGKKEISFGEVEIEKAKEYSCEDVDVALRLYNIFSKRLKEEGLERIFFDIEIPLIEVLMDMELAGIKIDIAELKNLSKEFQCKLDVLQEKIFKEAGEEFNINSPKQLGKVIFENLKIGSPKIGSPKRTKTGYSTDVEVLEALAQEHKLPALVLEFRSLSKLKSTYIDALVDMAKKVTSRVHTSFNQTVAATGRLSSSDPNLQNIPVKTEEGKKIRKAFIAEKGKVFLSADYSQIELRVLAHLSRDKALLEAFNNNEDVHAVTASGIFGIPAAKVTKEQRNVGKTVNFSTIYGQGAFGLSKQLGIEIGDAKEYIKSYFERYPSVEKYREKILALARETGLVETLFGRRRHLPDINSRNAMVKQGAERAAFNTVFQGTAADIIKKAMIKIHDELPKKIPSAKMLLQVHDELLFEVAKEDAGTLSKFVKKVMEEVVKLDVPLVVDVGVGENWLDAH